MNNNLAEDIFEKEDSLLSTLNTFVDEDTANRIEGKPLVVFGLPGAFTPTCSKSMLPGYEAMYDEFAALGYEVLCVSVNDIYVMKAWFKELGIEKVLGGADGNGWFADRIGMLVAKTNKNMGFRSWRYACVFNKEGDIEKFFQEKGACSNAEEDPYEESKPEKVYEYLITKHTTVMDPS